jgi:hypothetical protein
MKLKTKWKEGNAGHKKQEANRSALGIPLLHEELYGLVVDLGPHIAWEITFPEFHHLVKLLADRPALVAIRDVMMHASDITTPNVLYKNHSKSNQNEREAFQEIRLQTYNSCFHHTHVFFEASLL